MATPAVGGKAQPSGAHDVVMRDTAAVEKYPADIEGGLDMALTSRLAIELQRMAVIAGHALGVLVTQRQRELRRSVGGGGVRWQRRAAFACRPFGQLLRSSIFWRINPSILFRFVSDVFSS